MLAVGVVARGARRGRRRRGRPGPGSAAATPDDRPRRARSSSTRRPPPGIDHTYDGDFDRSRSGAAWPSSTATATAGPSCTSPAAASPAALYRNDSPVGGALQFTAVHDPATDLADVTGAYPLDIDGDGQVDLAVLRVGENVLLRGLGDCRFERANEAWAFDGGDGLDDRLQRDVGGRGRRCRRSPSATTCTLDATGAADHRLCADNALLRPDAGGAGYAAADRRSTPGYCTLSMLFSDWDRSGRRDLRVSNDRQYYPATAQEQLWRDRAGRGAAALHRGRRLGAASRSRGWASPATTSPATATRTST